MQPRTETMVSILIKLNNKENKNILILKQEIKENVYCGNIVNTVKNDKITVSVLNISEQIQEIRHSYLRNIRYEEEYESHLNTNINKNV